MIFCFGLKWHRSIPLLSAKPSSYPALIWLSAPSRTPNPRSFNGKNPSPKDRSQAVGTRFRRQPNKPWVQGCAKPSIPYIIKFIGISPRYFFAILSYKSAINLSPWKKSASVTRDHISAKYGLAKEVDQLLIDVCIMNEVREHLRNLAVAYYDYQKAYDRVHHD